MISQTKTIQISVLIINNLIADLLIRQIFFRQMLKMSQFAKLSLHTVYKYIYIYVAIILATN